MHGAPVGVERRAPGGIPPSRPDRQGRPLKRRAGLTDPEGMRHRTLAFSVLALLLAAPAAADDYPWIVVYSQQRCATVESVNPEFTVANLVESHGCAKEPEVFGHDDILSVGCESTLGTGFILARNQASCELALRALLEAEAAGPASD